MVLSKKANNKDADQTARMRRLVCAFVVHNPPKTGFLATRPIWIFIIGSVYMSPDDKDATNNFLRNLQSFMTTTDIPIDVTGDFKCSTLLMA